MSTNQNDDYSSEFPEEESPFTRELIDFFENQSSTSILDYPETEHPSLEDIL